MMSKSMPKDTMQPLRMTQIWNALSRQISAAARNVLHCVFSRLELVG